MKYIRHYSGYLDYLPRDGGSLYAKHLVVRDESIGFELIEAVPGGDPGWSVSGTAIFESGKYVASGVVFQTTGAKSPTRLLQFVVVDEVAGEFVVLRGSLEGADFGVAEFEGTLEYAA